MTVMTNDAASAYADTSSSTTSGPMLINALYDRLAVDVRLARDRIDSHDVNGAHNALMHAQRIVRVLLSALQPELWQGGEVLQRLYNTLLDLLVKANLHKDASYLAICEVIIEPLHEAWKQAVPKAMAEAEAAERARADAHVA
jgi:flagellar protein FliS